MKEQEAGGGFELDLGLSFALGLEGAELDEGFVELAGEAVLVQGEDGELADVVGGAYGGGEGVVGLGVAGLGAVDVVVQAEGEEVGFHGADAVEAPGSVGQGLGEVGFGGALG